MCLIGVKGDRCNTGRLFNWSHSYVTVCSTRCQPLEGVTLCEDWVMWVGSPFTPTNAFTPKCRSVSVHELSSIDIRHLVLKAPTQWIVAQWVHVAVGHCVTLVGPSRQPWKSELRRTVLGGKKLCVCTLNLTVKYHFWSTHIFVASGYFLFLKQVLHSNTEKANWVCLIKRLLRKLFRPMNEGIIKKSRVNFTIDFSLHQKLRQVNHEGLD